MKVTQTDFYNDTGDMTEFINAMESRHYPIFATMYHPEYQLLDFPGPKKWHLATSETTDEIAFRLSQLMNMHARSNSNRVRPGYEELLTKKMSISRVPA